MKYIVQYIETNFENLNDLSKYLYHEHNPKSECNLEMNQNPELECIQNQIMNYFMVMGPTQVIILQADKEFNCEVMQIQLSCLCLTLLYACQQNITNPH